MKPKFLLFFLFLFIFTSFKANAGVRIPVPEITREKTFILFDLSSQFKKLSKDPSIKSQIDSLKTNIGEYDQIACIYMAKSAFNFIPMSVWNLRYCLVSKKGGTEYLSLSDENAQQLAQDLHFKLPTKRAKLWDKYGGYLFIVLIVVVGLFLYRKDFEEIADKMRNLSKPRDLE